MKFRTIVESESITDFVLSDTGPFYDGLLGTGFSFSERENQNVQIKPTIKGRFKIYGLVISGIRVDNVIVDVSGDVIKFNFDKAEYYPETQDLEKALKKMQKMTFTI